MSPSGLRMALALVGAVVSWQVLADDGNAYVGIAAGLSGTTLARADVEAAMAGAGLSGLTSLDDSDMGIKLYAGIAVSRFLALEAGYTDFGRFRFHANRTSAGGGTFFGGDAVTRSVDLSARAGIPLGGAFSLFGRAGLAMSQTKVSTTTTRVGGPVSTSEHESTVSPLAGLGAAWRMASHVSLRLEAERHFDIDDGKALGKQDVDLYSLAVQYHF
ncbi:MAG TPA: outer membrane beta-barrel protein [Burkholderiales bacterium]|nr:outer membrane beta-barrel protein [Burkholderiales bacterium]